MNIHILSGFWWLCQNTLLMVLAGLFSQSAFVKILNIEVLHLACGIAVYPLLCGKRQMRDWAVLPGLTRFRMTISILFKKRDFCVKLVVSEKWWWNVYWLCALCALLHATCLTVTATAHLRMPSLRQAWTFPDAGWGWPLIIMLMMAMAFIVSDRSVSE